MKSKFAHLNLGNVEVLSKEQKSKVQGGYGNLSSGSATCAMLCSVNLERAKSYGCNC